MNAKDIRIATVIGAGAMGAGIAGELARLGCTVRLMDVTPNLLRRGVASARAAARALVEAGRISRSASERALKRIGTTTSLAEACRDTDLVVEAVSEDLALKRRLFRQFEGLCPAHAILASNSSGLSITRIAAATRRPERVAGLHFWNPPHIIPLVEVTQGRRTSAATAARLMRICRRMGKRPIRVRRDIPGFVGNRLQFAVLREALHLLAAGVASAEDIDTAMTAGPGLRYGLLGPLRTADLGGLDVFSAISRYLFAELSAARKPPALLAALVRAGRLGAKTGAGFYAYTNAGRQRIVARRDRVLLGFLKVLDHHNEE
jgi:3-hydroxybutyryl-CoA dehydrogenase